MPNKVLAALGVPVAISILTRPKQTLYVGFLQMLVDLDLFGHDAIVAQLVLLSKPLPCDYILAILKNFGLAYIQRIARAGLLCSSFDTYQSLLWLLTDILRVAHTTRQSLQ